MSPEPAARPRMRLRGAVASRELDGRGVAVSAGGSAVVVDGAHGARLWAAIEPLLRTGVVLEALVAGVPQAARPTVSRLLDELDAHRLLEEVEAELDEALLASPAARALPYLRSVSRTPHRAVRRIARSQVRLEGDARLMPKLVERVSECGFASVASAPGPAGLVIGSVSEGAGSGEWMPAVAVAARGDHLAVGPSDGPLDAALLDRLRAWQAVGPQGAAGDLHVELVAAQFALALLAALARGDEPQGGSHPSFLASTGELVAEPHPMVYVPPAPFAPAQFARGTDARGATEILDALEPVWDPVFGLVPAPLPLDLPQQPLGLAVVGSAGDTLLPQVAGAGTTTAEARLDAAFTALERRADRHAGPATTGFGVDADGALAAAVARRLAAAGDAGWRPAETPTIDTRTGRWLAGAAVMLLERTPRFACAVGVDARAGLVRVHADLGAGAEGLAFGTEMQATRDAALARAVAAAQLAATGRAVRPDPLDAHSPAARTLVDWIEASGALVAEAAADPHLERLGLRAATVRTERT